MSFSVFMADIDLFMLKEKDQLTDKKCLFNSEQIRTQMKTSAQLLSAIFQEVGIRTDVLLKPMEDKL